MCHNALLVRATLCCALACGLWAAPAGAIPTFAAIYDKPCGTCHTVFPQLNPAGESFRARGFHGLTPAIEPLRLGRFLDVPGTLPLALYLAAGVDHTGARVPAEHDTTRTGFDLNFFRLLAGGEVGQHVAFLFDHELMETDPETGDIEINELPYQAYATAHAGYRGWLGNLKGGWYELPLGVSPQIHRLSIRPYLIYGLNACALLDTEPPHGKCENQPVLGETQIGAELSASHPEHGLGWAAGFTNGSNQRLDSSASEDFFAHASGVVGPCRLGLFLFYNPDIVGGGVGDRALRLGPDLDFYRRGFRLLGQFLAAYESNPTGHDEELWFYGGFLEGEVRLTPSLLSLLRIDWAWTPRFDDLIVGGETRTRRQLWELTAGGQWLIWQNAKLVAEVAYGENHDDVGGRTARYWAATFRLVSAFWPLAPAGPRAPEQWPGTR